MEGSLAYKTKLKNHPNMIKSTFNPWKMKIIHSIRESSKTQYPKVFKLKRKEV